ncbi:uncharacterized protein BX663DRAFT_557791 [Cokeromyces recurvatus]|uniref:uncharacterized protein n=1 Tax=Cokeromyces recurvatus TaxID=90255 RepID=UPI00221F1590|nr:uncharacterized protein BX663DRAFT_557791 [Cokeromyces recurvatus]KAI7907209.1 hypothetical protein BX663DRAFT_557791 [Cokeromyces recurvatus]
MRNNWARSTIGTPAFVELDKARAPSHTIIDESLKGSYLVMDNCTTHKLHPMIRKIEGRGYRVMYLPPLFTRVERNRKLLGYCKKKNEAQGPNDRGDSISEDR